MPEIGRFTTIDPMAMMMADQNPYHYTYNNPILFIDPSGMLPKYNWETGRYEDDDGNEVSYHEAFAAHGIDTGGDKKTKDKAYSGRRRGC